MCSECALRASTTFLSRCAGGGVRSLLRRFRPGIKNLTSAPEAPSCRTEPALTGGKTTSVPAAAKTTGGRRRGAGSRDWQSNPAPAGPKTLVPRPSSASASSSSLFVGMVYIVIEWIHLARLHRPHGSSYDNLAVPTTPG